MSGEGAWLTNHPGDGSKGQAAPAASGHDDQVQCRGCGCLHQGCSAVELPDNWDAIFAPGTGWLEYCGGCVACGLMEYERSYRGMRRREEWHLPEAIAAIYRPVQREILIAVPGGQAAVPADHAERLARAIMQALAVRDHAVAMAAGEKSA